MLETYTVSFFGHRRLEDLFATESRLEELVGTLLREKEYVEFLVGRDGDFDQLVASTVKRCKRSIRDDNSSLIWIAPYTTAELRNSEESLRRYYDEIEVCSNAERSHFKSSFQIRNRSMVDRSNLVVFCVDHRSGGAYQTMRYAEETGMPCINLLQLR